MPSPTLVRLRWQRPVSCAHHQESVQARQYDKAAFGKTETCAPARAGLGIVTYFNDSEKRHGSMLGRERGLCPSQGHLRDSLRLLAATRVFSHGHPVPCADSPAAPPSACSLQLSNNNPSSQLPFLLLTLSHSPTHLSLVHTAASYWNHASRLRSTLRESMTTTFSFRKACPHIVTLRSGERGMPPLGRPAGRLQSRLALPTRRVRPTHLGSQFQHQTIR